MGKLDQTLRARRGVTGAITSELTPSGKTGNNGAGFTRDAKGELFLLAVANFVGEDTFYEDAKGRDTRFRDLVRQCANEDAAWTFHFLVWLRGTANMRSASIVGAIEAAKVISERTNANHSVLISKKSPFETISARALVNNVLLRADEPGEALAYWLSTYGRPVPKWLKRGLGDAIVRLYTPYTFQKWDSDRNAVRFADVLEYTQIDRTKGTPKEDLFKYILDSRHGHANGIPETLPLLRRAALLRSEGEPTDWLNPQVLRDAGMTWEDALSAVGNKVDKAKVWEALIDAGAMGYMALIRSLRNFDQAGISKAHRNLVAAILVEPEAVEKSRQLPMRFLSAYNNAPSDFWKPVLDDAATHALRNVPQLGGRTLVLIDTSGSMCNPFSSHRGRRSPEAEVLMRWDAAALFGIALGKACANADVVSFSGSGFGYSWGTIRRSIDSKQFDLRKGENLLAAVARFRTTHFLNGGTDTAGAVRTWFKGHDRIVLLTDEQANHDPHGVFTTVPAKVPTYTFNLAGYKYGHAASGPNRFVVGGLSDAGFQMIAALEARKSGRWPWGN